MAALRRPVPSRPRRALACLFALSTTAAAGQAAAALAPPALPDGFHRRTVAEVDGQVLPMALVFEQWGPVWEELVDQARRGKKDREAFTREAQAEWTRAVEAAVREELFYRESLRMVEQIKRRIAEQLQRQTTDASIQEIRRRVDENIARDLDRQLQKLLNDAQREAGGAAALQRNLARRGLAVAEWRERLRRKAMTGLYFATNAKPSLQNPTPQRIRAYYQRHRATAFVRPGRVVFRHVLFDGVKRGGAEAARAAAVDTWQRLTLKETTFDAAVGESDDDASRARGGLEDGRTGPGAAADPEREVWLRALRDAARDETPGELSGILESAVGYHLIVVLQKFPDAPAPFAEVQDEIRGRITGEDQRRDMEGRYRQLLREVPVRLVQERVPAECGWDAVVAGAAPGRTPTIRRVY